MCLWQQRVCRIARCLGFLLSLRSRWWWNHMFMSSKKVIILRTNVRWSAPWIVLIPLDTTRLQFTTWTELANLSLASGFWQEMVPYKTVIFSASIHGTEIYHLSKCSAHWELSKTGLIFAVRTSVMARTTILSVMNLGSRERYIP